MSSELRRGQKGQWVGTVDPRAEHMALFAPIVYATMENAFQNAQLATTVTQATQATQPPNPSANRSTELHLSVSMPVDAQPGDDLPVVAFVHGGAFIAGSRTEGWFHGSGFTRDQVVLVTIDYRLSAPGFLPFGDDLPNHYRGVDDVHLALAWIQRNIEDFGGDPTNVTLMGQSAGGGIVLWLSRADHFDGMFRRVWAMSPGLPRDHVAAHQTSLRAALGMPLTRSALAKAKPAKLQRGLERYHKLRFSGIPFGPAPLDPQDLARVDMVLTSTSAEFWHAPRGKKVDASRFGRSAFGRRQIAKMYGATSKYVDYVEANGGHMAANVVGDAFIRSTVARAALGANPDVWVAQYEGGNAFHCVDIPLVFDSAAFVQPGKIEVIPNPPEALVQRAHGLAVDFACGNTPSWPRYQQHRQALSIATEAPEAGAVTLKSGALDYLDGAFA
ncbi:carboxylesterase family protein [Corynebacterium sp. 153RC1]|uniref:carboxylesterase family protein n=1 Tax=unclassified Corynebacterium TaxID=2624378 RepID=UPI00211C5F00|nr:MULTISPECIES: carboxylesterase family protein [unclassified Corynebacterium]MCQ9370634.1 carboxylesterase family protein [Corynebacterium sp. 35RC1]MCQ9352368.1 carboxylesterase family protein [Corynebacterium sp. 209RC1]MCQ9354242.1 carboxylesterase family protein [Corynebacterium sp. 1222RC1]MCQ9356524.1 carboxylesterase family protein [Corynebacterium sp. 122RC1]MCQ9358892.1 carboxylesterase family protein [Corynebacterium sp. 142RC1]